MNNVHLLKRFLGAILAIPVILFWCPYPSGAASQPITPEALRYSGPFEITSRIMEIDHEKKLLVVAEKEIHVVDITVAGEHLLTLLSDAEGEPLVFDALTRGQTVLVKGIELPDGRVIAELIQITAGRSYRGHSESRRPAIRQVREIRRIN
jgi:hypothetical protein